MNYITTAALVALGAVLMGWLPISQIMEPTAPEDVQRQSRFERAAEEICGINAAWSDLGNGAIQCLTHAGKKAQRTAIK